MSWVFQMAYGTIVVCVVCSCLTVAIVKIIFSD